MQCSIFRLAPFTVPKYSDLNHTKIFIKSFFPFFDLSGHDSSQRSILRWRSFSGSEASLDRRGGDRHGCQGGHDPHHRSSQGSRSLQGKKITN
jgi:hypothetical protein